MLNRGQVKLKTIKLVFVAATLIWAVVVLLSDSRAIINDLDVILHSFM